MKIFARDFTPTPLTKLLAQARIKHYPKGQILLYSGDVTTELYFLKKGIAKVYDIDYQGNEKILHLLKPPGIMPLTFFRGTKQPTAWFYSAITDCYVYTLPQTEVEQAMEADGTLALALVRQFASETHELLIRLSSLGKTDVRDKLAYLLRFLAACHASSRTDGWRRVTFPVSHQLLADMIGMTRESTALGMKQLRTRKIVRNPRPTILEVHFEHLLSQTSLT